MSTPLAIDVTRDVGWPSLLGSVVEAQLPVVAQADAVDEGHGT